jgi:PAS domain S-box-containing protein
MEYRRRTKSGDWKWIRSIGKIVEFDKDGTPLKMSGTHTDISDIKLAEKELKVSEENFKNLVESMPEGYYKSTPQGKFIYVNPAMVNMFGYDSSEELMSVHIPSELYFQEEDRTKFNAPRDGFNSVSEMYRMKKKDGSEIWLEDFSRYTRNDKGEIILHEGVCRDVTTRKKINEELISAKEKAEELSRIKSNFLANMSHELRTPMVGILGFSEVLKNSLEDEEFRHYADVIHKGGTRLMDTLNLILNISAIESDKINIEFNEFDLVSEIKEVVEVFEKTAIQKGLSLKVESGFESKLINSDKKIVHQILSNLVNNSIKYTFKGSILITVDDVVKNNKLYAGIHIIDTGIGIPEDKLDLIWEDFRQVSEGLTRGFEGTGLGLSITKRFIQKLGGEIFVESSKPGFGTTFTVLFPLNEYRKDNSLSNRKLQTESNFKEEKQTVEFKKTESLPNALFVDDDIMSIDLVKILIKPVCNLDIAVNGIEAVEKAKAKKYDIILMDINLGKDIDGLETTELIRTIRGYEKTPVVAVTALAMKDDKEDFLNKGCTHYISKPFLKDDFVSLIKKVLSENKNLK